MEDTQVLNTRKKKIQFKKKMHATKVSKKEKKFRFHKMAKIYSIQVRSTSLATIKNHVTTLNDIRCVWYVYKKVP